MNVKEAAKLWNVSERTVRRYCKNGYIMGAYKIGGKWHLPNNSLQPYISRKKKFTGRKDKQLYVLKAIDSEQYLDFRLMAMSQEEFMEIAKELEALGYIGSNLKITPNGGLLLDEYKRRHTQDVHQGIQTAASLVGIIPNFLTMLTA